MGLLYALSSRLVRGLNLLTLLAQETSEPQRQQVRFSPLRKSSVIERKISTTTGFALFKERHVTLLTFLKDGRLLCDLHKNYEIKIKTLSPTEQFCMLSYRTAQCTDRAMMTKSRKRRRGDGQMSLSCLFAVVVRILLLLRVIGAIFRMLKMMR